MAEIIDSNGKVVRKLSGAGETGFHSVKWDLKTEAAKDLKQKKSATLPLDYAKTGTYTIKISHGTATAEAKIVIR
jgi:hypothetical protein